MPYYLSDVEIVIQASNAQQAEQIVDTIMRDFRDANDEALVTHMRYNLPYRVKQQMVWVNASR